MSLIHSRFFLFSLSLALIASPSIVAGYVCLIEFLIEICLAAITSKLFAHYYFGWWRKKDNSGRIKTIPFAQRTDRCIWFSCLAIAFTQTRESCAHVWKSSFSVWDSTGGELSTFLLAVFLWHSYAKRMLLLSKRERERNLGMMMIEHSPT